MHFNKILTLSTEWFSFKIYLSRDFDYFREKKSERNKNRKSLLLIISDFVEIPVFFFAK